VIQLLLNLAPLALGAAINPAMIMMVLTLLLSATKPLARAVAFVMGAATTSAVLGLIGLLTAIQPGQLASRRGPSTGEALLVLGAGLLLLVFAGWHAVRKPPTRSARPPSRRGELQQQMQLRTARPVVAYLIGAGFMLTNVKALALYGVALKQIADAPLSDLASVVFAAGFIVIMLLGLELPIVLYVADRQRARSVLAQVRHWIEGHERLLMISVALVLGSYLTVRGIVSLVA
jgi:threonine/homoserine/homoserine lactone efflux protein